VTATVTELGADAPALANESSLGRRQPRRGGNPWRHPWFLEGFTWLYVIWSIVPIGIAALFSFNNGKSQSTWQGFSMRWYITDPLQSVLHDPVLHSAVIQTLKLATITTAITVPIGFLFAVGIDRWRGRTSSGLNLVMVFSFVIPELLLAIALYFVFVNLYTPLKLGTTAEVIGLMIWNISWPAIIIRTRLIGIGRTYEEAAADLGASRLSSMWRVLLPMLAPAIVASAVLVFASVIDDFVIVEQLSSTAGTQPMSVIIYSETHGGLAGPALNALATLMLLFSLVVAIAGYVVYRLMTRGERAARGSGTQAARQEALATIAGT
jgi:spermidine/putrescine transport system permease protein